MISLITLLISLLGYGTPADFQHFTEEQLTEQIQTAEQNNAEDSGLGSWESPD